MLLGMRNHIAIVYVVYLAMSALLYAPSVDNSFRDEDFAHLRYSSEKASLSEVIKPTQFFASDRPGALSLFYLEYRIFKLNSEWYLLFNYLLHILISLLAWRVFLALGLGQVAAALGASLFVLGYGHYGKVVIDGDRRIDGGKNDQSQIAFVQGIGQQHELAHKTDKGRYSCQSKHADCQGKGHERCSFV